MPTVNGFTANGNIGNGQTGLKITNNSSTPCAVTGTGLADGQEVDVDNGSGITWKGTLNVVNSQYKCNLKCTNASRGLGETEEVSVTVGASAPFTTNVNTGP